MADGSSGSTNSRHLDTRNGASDAAIAEYACKECRRRKSKCDRTLPTCALCRKFRRTCVFEKQAKTPLTRRHLSSIEDELARTKSLVQRLLQEKHSHDATDASPAISDEGRATSSSQDDHHLAPRLGAPSQDFSQFSSIDVSQQYNTDQFGRTQSLTGHRATLSNPHSSHALDVHAHRLTTAEHDAFSSMMLETPPVSGDFNWDERTGKPTGDNFIDGMASLPNQSHRSGYLGVASGAAFLRLTDSETPEGGGTEEQLDGRMETFPRSVPRTIWSMGQLEPFIDAYFKLYHVSYPIVHEATFRAQFMEVIPRPKLDAWYVLLYIIAALGVFTTATQPTGVDAGLFAAAKARLSIDMLETGNLCLVQALTLISNYLQKRNKPNSGYNYTGLARRIATAIGLYKEFPNWDAKPLVLEKRRRVWWGLYIFDVGAIITFSRPLDFPEGGIDAELPLNVHDSDITASTLMPPTEANETTVYTHLRAQSMFHLATCQIYSKLISSPYPTAAELVELDDMLIQQWLATLPPYFQEHVPQQPRYALCHSILRCRYRNFRLLMYRPFLVRRVISRAHDNPLLTGEEHENPEAVEIAIQRCLNAAKESVELIYQFWGEGGKSMMACWYNLYFLFQAVLIPVLCLRNQPHSPLANGWRAQITTAIATMNSMSSLNPSAERCLKVVMSLCGAYLEPDATGAGYPTQESPQTQLAGLYPLMWPSFSDSQHDGFNPILQESTIMDFMNQMPEFN